jgi:site-specific recombinase XerD
LGNNNNVIYPVTERINSSYTRQAYKTSFNRFQSVIKIHDLQVLRDLGPKVMEQMIIKYVINARDVKKLSRASIQAECDAIYHFCELNDLLLNKKKILLLNKKKINRFLLPLLESFWLVSRTPYCLSQSSSSHDRPNFLYSSTPSLLL